MIFGPCDSFLNKFAALVRLFPALPIARTRTRFAPVYVGDVVEAMSRALTDQRAKNRAFELCGPQILSLGELIRYVATTLGKRCIVLTLPDPLGWLQAALLGLLPGKPLSLDNYHSLALDSVATSDGLGELGITPTPLAAVVPYYLGAKQREARFAAWRSAAGTRVGEAPGPTGTRQR